ncbi:MAG TPA: efflux RND transporter periplasmic adaptor subunit, partial [Chitinophagaceae bacterium]|nr:efflux RND transporter periplasmic adaptor subunit [Chitinophagaceae bacterium]
EQLSMTNVYAEMSGVADMVNLKVGEFFSPATAAQLGIRIVNNSTLKAVVDIPENYLSRVKQGTPVVIQVPDAGKTFNSKVSLISQVINANSRGFSVEAKIPSPAGLKPNQVANVRIQDYSANNVIVVPVNTVQTDEKGKYVYVLTTENGKKIARKKQVSIGELNGNDIEIKAGLASGDQLITEGHQSLYDGQSITTEVK